MMFVQKLKELEAEVNWHC